MARQLLLRQVPSKGYDGILSVFFSKVSLVGRPKCVTWPRFSGSYQGRSSSPSSSTCSYQEQKWKAGIDRVTKRVRFQARAENPLPVSIDPKPHDPR